MTFTALALFSVALHFAPRPPAVQTETEQLAACPECRAGQRLFFDKSLSSDGQLSCADCHLPIAVNNKTSLFGDFLPSPRARGKDLARVRTPALFDTGWRVQGGARFFWNGRAATLASAIFWPLFDRAEMGFSEKKIKEHGTSEEVAKNLGAFLETQKTGRAPFDDFLAGQIAALSPAQQKGLPLFVAAGCPQCHFGQELDGGGTQAHPLRYSHLDPKLFSDSEATYSSDYPLHSKPQDQVTLRSLTRSLRNLSEPLGRFGQRNSLEDFLPYHCTQFENKETEEKCLLFLQNPSSVIEFLRGGLRSFFTEAEKCGSSRPNICAVLGE